MNGNTWYLVLLRDYKDFEAGDVIAGGFFTFNDAENYYKSLHNDAPLCKIVENVRRTK